MSNLINQVLIRIWLHMVLVLHGQTSHVCFTTVSKMAPVSTLQKFDPIGQKLESA